ncbi:malonate decarboxylase holo-ACP synthase [Clostridium neuense]|uniref:malonate decarboxylase holo-ACP synthase n=1 Tax=Clostridium neuense TaxID=1728934 RepID=UPI0038783493
MELNPHDLIKIKNYENLNIHFSNYSWALEALKNSPFVVVRRAPILDKLIPIGIRGNLRSQRLAAFLPFSDIDCIFSPTYIVEKKLWLQNFHIKNTNIYSAIEALYKIFEEYNLKWGICGSAGFELITKIPTVTENSDLDIMIKIETADKLFSAASAKELCKKLFDIKVKIDIQIETPKGAVALTEYASETNPILIRTINGPKLIYREKLGVIL